MRIGKAGGVVGRSISAGRTLCTIIPFDQEAEKKIHSGEEDTFRRRRYIQEKKIYLKEVDMGEADLFKIIKPV